MTCRVIGVALSYVGQGVTVQIGGDDDGLKGAEIIILMRLTCLPNEFEC
jgi:hypothetical protein